MEGVVFDVQDHTRRIGTSGPIHMGICSVRTSMGLKSPSNGYGMAEVGQRRDEPLHEEDRRTFHQETMAELGLGGITHCRWDDCFRWTGCHLR
jgi:hypothetical protein